MKKNYVTILGLLLVYSIWGQPKQLAATLDESTVVANDGLYFDGTQGVNYQFSPRITPHGDCIDVVNGYVFVTWYKGGIDKRNLMLSRKNLNVPNSSWVTIEFPHQHVGFQGTNPTIGDSHNTAAIGVSTLDGTIHLLYDMHAYRESNLPDDFFNYSVSEKNKAFVPDAEFNLSIFKPKQNYLKLGQNYDRVTYPMLHRADNGSLVVRYRIGGSGNGDILLAHYDGSVWSDNWLFHEGTLALPNRNNMYGGERFLNGKFYSGFSIRYSTNSDTNTSNGYMLNSGLYYAYTNGIPANASIPWFDVDGASISLPIRNNIDPNLDPVQIAQPGDDYGTATLPRTSSDPSWTVTANGAIHFVTRVDNINVHYYKTASASSFSSASGGLIPNPDVRGELYSYLNHVFMVEILAGKVNIKTTLEGENDWKIVYTGTASENFMHFDAFVEGNKLYVYLMEQAAGDARPLHLKVFTLTEEDVPVVEDPDIVIEAEDYDTGGNNVGYYDLSSGNSGGVYRTDDVDIAVRSAASNGYAVIDFQGGEWLKYTFQVETAGTYDFVLVAANRNRDDSIMDIEINGVLYDNVLITRTFDWEVFYDTTISNVNLIQGTNVIKLTQRRSLSSTPDNLELYLKTPLSLNEFNESKIAIYPNPSSGIFNILTDFDSLEYTLVNIHGQILDKGSVIQKQVDFSRFNQGVYFLELATYSKKLVKKLVIK